MTHVYTFAWQIELLVQLNCLVEHVRIEQLSRVRLNSPQRECQTQHDFRQPCAHAGSGGTGGFEFGVDPNLDPELALALRMSMEDERARQAAAERAAAASAPSATAAQASTANAGAAVAPATADAATLHGDDGATPMEEDDADALLQQALAISMQVRCCLF